LLLFGAEIARDQGDFSIDDVLEKVKQKMIGRHPHVFGDVEVQDIAEIKKNWEKIKAREKHLASRQSLLERIPRHLPPLLQAYWAIRRAGGENCEPANPVEIVDRMEKKLKVLRKSFAHGNDKTAKHEVGNLFFTLIAMCRVLHVNPETAVHEGIQQFYQNAQRNEEAEKFGKNHE